MCTVTWWSDSERYELFFSRDERKDRAKGLSPACHEQEGITYLCPRDPDGGGTWLLVNDQHLTVCLVNQYPDDPAPLSQPRISRGRLVEAMASCGGVEAVSRRLLGMDLRHYEGFQLIALVPGSKGCLYHWDTRQLSVRDQARSFLPVTSSSFLGNEVVSRRRELFSRLVAGGGDPSPEVLRRFHQQFAPEAAAHSVFMQREDAETVSLCQVTAGPRGIELAYRPKEPGQQCFAEAVVTRLSPRSCAA